MSILTRIQHDKVKRKNMEQRLKDNDNKMSKPNISLIEISEVENRDLRKDTTERGNIVHFP